MYRAQKDMKAVENGEPVIPAGEIVQVRKIDDSLVGLVRERGIAGEQVYWVHWRTLLNVENFQLVFDGYR